jgi:hypothetical protein
MKKTMNAERKLRLHEPVAYFNPRGYPDGDISSFSAKTKYCTPKPFATAVTASKGTTGGTSCARGARPSWR